MVHLRHNLKGVELKRFCNRITKLIIRLAAQVGHLRPEVTFRATEVVSFAVLFIIVRDRNLNERSRLIIVRDWNLDERFRLRRLRRTLKLNRLIKLELKGLLTKHLNVRIGPFTLIDAEHLNVRIGPFTLIDAVLMMRFGTPKGSII